MSFFMLGCRDSGVIHNRDPFFTRDFPMLDSSTEAFVQRAEHFSRSHGMKIAVNRFGRGKFSTLVYNDRMNIGSLNTIYPGMVTIDAMTRDQTTDHDRLLVQAYITEVAPLLE
jgi:hypothetical protein